LKTLKKTFIMIILTLICVILIDNYNRAKDEQKLEKKKEDGKTNISETDKKTTSLMNRLIMLPFWRLGKII